MIEKNLSMQDYENNENNELLFAESRKIHLENKINTYEVTNHSIKKDIRNIKYKEDMGNYVKIFSETNQLAMEFAKLKIQAKKKELLDDLESRAKQLDLSNEEKKKLDDLKNYQSEIPVKDCFYLTQEDENNHNQYLQILEYTHAREQNEYILNKLKSLFKTKEAIENIQKNMLWVDDNTKKIVINSYEVIKSMILDDDAITKEYYTFFKEKFKGYCDLNDCRDWIREKGLEMKGYCENSMINSFHDLSEEMVYQRYIKGADEYMLIQISNKINNKNDFSEPMLFKIIKYDHDFIFPLVHIDRKNPDTSWDVDYDEKWINGDDDYEEDGFLKDNIHYCIVVTAGCGIDEDIDYFNEKDILKCKV